MCDVTTILSAINQGDRVAAEKLLPLVYDELRKLAAQRMAQERPGQTFDATALVHEAYLRLVKVAEPGQFDGRGHFFAAAAEAMRRILIDKARHKQAIRHGGGQERLDVDEIEIAAPAKEKELIAMDEALEHFAVVDKQKAELVKLRYFIGLTIEESARILDISPPTAKRWWAYSRAWLYNEIQDKAEIKQ